MVGGLCFERKICAGARMKSLRILLADDHDLVRRGLRVLLESHSDWSICAEAHTGTEAIAKAEEFKPDVIILDITMPELNGIEAAKIILKASPSTEILGLSAHYSDQLIREILDSGMHGYIAKSDPDSDLLPAVEALANHKWFFPTRARDLILSNFKSEATSGAPIIPGSSLPHASVRSFNSFPKERAVRKSPRLLASA
jgi:DNA-binding NarL/FixJ family response regulator